MQRSPRPRLTGALLVALLTPALVISAPEAGNAVVGAVESARHSSELVTKSGSVKAAKPQKPQKAQKARAAAKKKAARKRARRAARRTPVPVTTHQLPFVCDQEWVGSTRSHHSPSAHSIDFNAPDDLGKPVLASAPGRVVTAVNNGTSGYGRYVVVDHGNGESSVYAHLQHVHVVVGTWVDQGSLLGQLGTTGNSSGPHLHYEQKVGRGVVAPWINRVRYAYGTSRSSNCADVPLAGHFFEGEGAQVAVFRRTGNAQVHVRTPQGSSRVLAAGAPTDEPLVGDWTGEGLQSVGTFSPLTRTFTLAGEAGFSSLRFGKRGDRPVAGDWDGDGRWEIGVRRPGSSAFRLRSATGTVTTLKLGVASDVPLAGDWDGDGITDVGVFDVATATFTLRTRGATPTTVTVRHGSPGHHPVVADWDGDGVTDLGTWDPATATFAKRLAGAAGVRTETVRHGRAR
ncbi:VCBS repeat domain-containing M23 family metallopeptidase [Nocardioides sp. Y6]|uniref:VCBS repeat domain-containing M23 family metallopeptidase n=1 Tax=Nocardioides malaquae TaxID=2773426 RepID=A0ABR9RNE7_9ACTN|nr:VCBS repeat domain-containing M23 family metallopeptidase [Nocardioides malaquae]MBE7323098.1 VCBS repeat domain-containing M23 family metallopeptidase [Nocardioides malaquae]